MNNNLFTRPKTSNYRNESHIHFGDENPSKEIGSQCDCSKPKKRPQSYRNISKMSEFMTDVYFPLKQTSKIRYSNIIQNRDQTYEVPKANQISRNQHSHEFEAFFQKTGQRIYKPIDQFTEYSDLVNRNSQLLRRSQFDCPLENQLFSRHKRESSCSKIPSKTSKYYTYTKFKKTFGNSKMVNTIATSMCESIQERKQIKKEKQMFAYKTQKHTKPLNKTCLGYAKQYEELVDKERENKQKISLSNAMNRVLTMEVMGKQISHLTKMYI